MAYRKPDFTAEFMPPQQQPPPQGWIDMGEDQPIDFAPAVNAFQQRFMGARSAPAHGAPGPHTASPPPMAPMTHNEPLMVGGVHDVSKSPIKSL